MTPWTRSAPVLLVLVLATGQAHGHEASARYLGNEGVMVARGETKILFDAFYSDSYGSYLLVDESTRAALLAGEPPYDGIDAVFVSHAHGDHFTPQPTLDFLAAQPAVRLFAPSQAVDALTAAAGPEPDWGDRVTAYDLEPADPARSITVDGLRVEVVAIPHSGGERMADIDNLAFRVTLGEAPTALHLGDAGAVPADFERHRRFFTERQSDVAFPAFWLLLDPNGRTILDEQINAATIIGVHVPAEAVGNGDTWRERAGGDLFTDPGEVRVIPLGENSTD